MCWHFGTPSFSREWGEKRKIGVEKYQIYGRPMPGCMPW